MHSYLLATFSNFFVIIQSVDKKSLNPLSLNIIKKVCSHFFQWKIGICCIMLTMCFSRRSFARFLGHFWKLDIYFCPFSESDPISFRRLYKRNIFNKGYKEWRYPLCGKLLTYPRIDTPHLFLYYHKKGVFWGGFIWYYCQGSRHSWK